MVQKGHMVIPQFWKPWQLQLTVGDKTEVIERPVPQKNAGIEDEGYQFENAHENQSNRDGIKESPVMTWEETVSILKQCDMLRKQWGLKYPQD